jgi:hypothetical protein
VKNLAAVLFVVAALSGCTFSFGPSQQQSLPEPKAGTAEEQKEAAEAARGYLSQIDSGDYEATWRNAGPALRGMTSEFAWINTLKLARKTFAILPGRKIEGFGFTTQVDANAPVGEYVLVQFVSRSGKLTATEKVVMQREHGKWKLVGYFITKRAEYKSGT